MRSLRKLLGPLVDKSKNQSFLLFLDEIEDFFAKILSLVMILVVLFAIIDLCIVLTHELLSPPIGRFSVTLLKIFGLFLNVLIALEITQNITSYLGSHIM